LVNLPGGLVKAWIQSARPKKNCRDERKEVEKKKSSPLLKASRTGEKSFKEGGNWGPKMSQTLGIKGPSRARKESLTYLPGPYRCQ